MTIAYQFFNVPVQYPDEAAKALNGFLTRHTIQAIDRQFVAAGGQSAWCFCVAYQSLNANHTGTRSRKESVDYREKLSEADFEVFAELRRLRKALAEEQAVLPYTIFNNEQLATLVTQRVRTIADLRTIAGVGQARCDRYGQLFIDLLEKLQADQGTTKLSE